ncbi:MAG: AarF/ABC1/UbiB kinase family protein, partial [Cyanobacteria bacterium J06627_8]
MSRFQDSPETQRYDYQAIARHYRVRPLKVIARALVIIWSFAGFVIGLQFDRWRNASDQQFLKRAAQLRETLTHLGPTYIKIGQALSTRADLIRKDF